MSRPSRSWTIALSLLIVTVLAAACSGGSSGGLGSSTSSGSTAPTTSRTGPTDTGSSGSLPSKADMESVLLTEDDLPSGFTKDRSADSSGSDSGDDVHAADPECDDALQGLQQRSTKNKVTVDFNHEETEYVSQDVSARRDAASHFTDVLDTLKDKCGSEFRLKSTGGTIQSGRLKLLPDPGIGDHSALIQLTFNGKTQGVKFTSQGYFVAVQRGPITTTIQAYDVEAPSAGLKGTPPSESDATALAEAADKKAEDLVG